MKLVNLSRRAAAALFRLRIKRATSVGAGGLVLTKRTTDQKASSANPSGGTSTLPLTESEVGRWEGPLARRLF